MASAGRPGPLLPVPTAQYERDVKRMKKRGKDLAKLRAIVESLRAGPTLPARCRDHPLQGGWSGWRDCHVEPDWLLIYRRDRKAGELILGRTGTHADLLE